MRIGRWLPAMVLLVTLAVALSLMLAACAEPKPTLTPSPTATVAATPTPTATPAATSTPAASPTPESPVAAGQALYLAKGCAGCHGQEAEGTTFAPPLPGHTGEQVRRQMRNPVGKMPAFSEAQVSDAELDQIAAFIASLEAGMAHVKPLEMEDLLAFHHWMTIMALKAENEQDAIHHIDHIIAMVDDPEHKHQMEEARELIQVAKYHDAEHEVEEVLAGRAEPDLSLMQLHLRLALAATEAKDPEDAMHHMDHFMEEATGADLVKGQEVIDLLKAEEYHEAGEEIESLLGMESQGY